MKIRQITSALVLLIAGVTSERLLATNTSPSVVAGVWKGTIGGAPVVACLTPASEQPGSYYYTRHGESISLYLTNDNASVLHEGLTQSTGATWMIETVSDKEMAGTWSNGTSRKLSIKLSRLAELGNESGDECGAPGSKSFYAFNKARLDALPINAHVSQNSRSLYRKSDAAVVNMPLEIENVDAVKILTTGWLDSHTASSYACHFRQSVSGQGNNEPFQYKYTLTLRSISPSWLVATQLGSSSCGDGDSIPSDIESFVWNRTSGKEVSIWDWISNGTPARTPSPALQAVIMKFTRFDGAPSDCRDAIENNSEYVIWPTSRGLVFEGMVFASRACLFETEVPYDSLRQFMTQSGLSAADSFKEENARDLYNDQLQ
jgi:hypothetical protein